MPQICKGLTPLLLCHIMAFDFSFQVAFLYFILFLSITSCHFFILQDIYQFGLFSLHATLFFSLSNFTVLHLHAILRMISPLPFHNLGIKERFRIRASWQERTNKLLPLKRNSVESSGKKDHFCFSRSSKSSSFFLFFFINLSIKPLKLHQVLQNPSLILHYYCRMKAVRMRRSCMMPMEVCNRSLPMAVGRLRTDVGEAVPIAKRKELLSIRIKVLLQENGIKCIDKVLKLFFAQA